MRFGAMALVVAALATGCGSRTGLHDGEGPDGGPDTFPDAPLLPPTLTCSPLEAWTTIGRTAVAYAEAEDDGWIVRWEWSVVVKPEASATSPEPVLAPTSSITPDAEGDYVLEVVATDDDGLTASCRVTVHSVVGPPVAFCPDDVDDARVGRPQPLEGDAFDDELLVSFEWRVFSAPEGSTARPDPSAEPSTTFTPDVTGEYQLRFTVVDNDGQEASCVVTLFASGTPEAICPPDATIPTRRAHTLRGDAEDDGEIVAWLWELVERPPGSAAELDRATRRQAELLPDVPGSYRARLTVTDDTGLTDSCETALEATPTAPAAICPDRVDTTPLTEVTLRGAAEDDGEIVRWHWELLEAPPGSAAAPPFPSDEATTRFTPDVAGEYRLLLVVVDDDGMEGSCEVVVAARPGEGLRVELYWNPPDRSCDEPHGALCDSSDVDLHLLHPDGARWFSELDCHYANCQWSPLEWDLPGGGDNPRLDLDDVEGFGPENVNIDAPFVGHAYEVGVHYYDADRWTEPTQAYVRVYCGFVSLDPIYEVGPVAISAAGGFEGHDFWRVAAVEWNGAACEVTPRYGPDGGPDIITTAAAQAGR